MLRLSPVSYTHLDVYKRQILIRAELMFPGLQIFHETHYYDCLLYTSRCV